jgi:glycogen(starch) synthase
MKVLHVLESSIPDTGGYVIRASAIIEQQQRLGLEPVVVTSPLFPLEDRSVVRREPWVEEIGGVRHYRTNHIPAPAMARTKLGSYASRLMMLRRYRQALLQIVADEKPDVMHAHSSYTNPYAAQRAARRFNLPLIYEVRTLWGESAVVEDGLRTDSWKYRLVWGLELGAMRQADAVIPIAAGIRDALVRRGVRAAKMTIVPNGVDSTRFVPRARDAERARSCGLDGKFVVGFIGSMRRLEGLSTLVQAFGMCRERDEDMRLVLVGDGPDKKDLQALVAASGIEDVVFTGNVPHQDVDSWYSVMDLVVYPRIRATINERVTPLKPLEAMALGKVCIGSDVGGLRELIANDRTGVLFPSGDAGELASVLLDLKGDVARRQRLANTALEFVRQERDWSAIIPRTVKLYERLIAERGEPCYASHH